jgi:hypothetical protein
MHSGYLLVGIFEREIERVFKKKGNDDDDDDDDV